jgi:hypothetical protein
MANPARGELDACFGDRRLTLCLTLGALAELEGAFGVEDLSALAERFSAGRFSARDLTRILGAAVRGGGTPLTDAEVGALPTPGGIPGALATVLELLEVTFGSGGEENPRP